MSTAMPEGSIGEELAGGERAAATRGRRYVSENNGDGIGPLPGEPPTLREIGISADQSARYQKFVAMPERRGEIVTRGERGGKENSEMFCGPAFRRFSLRPKFAISLNV
ncbi:MAG TPA: hypothetical protein VMA37_01515 [Acetobacteraceae bacterium]|nr:hypothetical protein [Acetobacteraceae bacterium]